MLYIVGNNMDKHQLDEHCMLLLTEQQKSQLQLYAHLLIEWNKKFNLTAIVDLAKIESHHFYDSLEITRFIDFTQLKQIADVGTGAGFPAIPLKIMFPHLAIVLIEVNSKKRAFLEYVIQKLGLTSSILYPYDWRTFLRSTNYTIDYFFARASLQPEELVRIFKPGCVYQQAGLVYWASQQWQPAKQELPFIEKEVSYQVEPGLTRRYIFFRKS
jgi:16S rRNA (guanine(527)-N(7))-methyltransferase RsmG